MRWWGGLGLRRRVDRDRAVRRGLAAVFATATFLVPAFSAYAASPLTAPEQVAETLDRALALRQSEDARRLAAAEKLAKTRARALATLAEQADAHELVVLQRQVALLAMKYAESRTGAKYYLPVPTFVRTSHFGAAGQRWEDGHTGEDFAAPVGSPLVAIADATVTEVGDAGAYGLRTVLTLSDGTQLWYCHQSATQAKVGKQVKAGQVIGAVGSSGNATGPHLHLEVRPPGAGPVDPVPWLRALGLLL